MKNTYILMDGFVTIIDLSTTQVTNVVTRILFSIERAILHQTRCDNFEHWIIVKEKQ